MRGLPVVEDRGVLLGNGGRGGQDLLGPLSRQQVLGKGAHAHVGVFDSTAGLGVNSGVECASDCVEQLLAPHLAHVVDTELDRGNVPSQDRESPLVRDEAGNRCQAGVDEVVASTTCD